MPSRLTRRGYRWTAAAVVLAIVLYVAAIRNDFYQLTSPATLTWHVALRKAYSLVAFGTLAYLVRRALVERGSRPLARATVLGLALYSGAIEAGQYLAGSTEGIGWNAFDVACGIVGGALGTADLAWRRAISLKRARDRASLRR